MNTNNKSTNEAHSEPLQQCSVVGSAFEMSWNLTAVEKALFEFDGHTSEGVQKKLTSFLLSGETN